MYTDMTVIKIKTEGFLIGQFKMVTSVKLHIFFFKAVVVQCGPQECPSVPRGSVTHAARECLQDRISDWWSSVCRLTLVCIVVCKCGTNATTLSVSSSGPGLCVSTGPVHECLKVWEWSRSAGQPASRRASGTEPSSSSPTPCELDPVLLHKVKKNTNVIFLSCYK